MTEISIECIKKKSMHTALGIQKGKTAAFGLLEATPLFSKKGKKLRIPTSGNLYSVTPQRTEPPYLRHPRSRTKQNKTNKTLNRERERLRAETPTDVTIIAKQQHDKNDKKRQRERKARQRRTTSEKRKRNKTKGEKAKKKHSV